MNDQSQMLNQSYLPYPNPNFNNWSSTNSNYYIKTHQNDTYVSKSHKFHPKKKLNNRHAPYAPRNTTSFLIRAKKSGGITSPCPVTPAVLPTPVFSPLREAVVDTAKEEWGVNGYGTMSGLLWLKELEKDVVSDVEEELVEVESWLNYDLSRFEMIYPYNESSEMSNKRILESRTENENVTWKDRLFFMERELEDMRRRVMVLERGKWKGYGEDLVSDNEDNCGDVCSGRIVNDDD